MISTYVTIYDMYYGKRYAYTKLLLYFLLPKPTKQILLLPNKLFKITRYYEIFKHLPIHY